MVGKLACCFFKSLVWFFKLTLESEDSLCVVSCMPIVKIICCGMAMCNLILLKYMLTDARE